MIINRLIIKRNFLRLLLLIAEMKEWKVNECLRVVCYKKNVILQSVVIEVETKKNIFLD